MRRRIATRILRSEQRARGPLRPRGPADRRVHPRVRVRGRRARRPHDGRRARERHADRDPARRRRPSRGPCESPGITCAVVRRRGGALADERRHVGQGRAVDPRRRARARCAGRDHPSPRAAAGDQLHDRRRRAVHLPARRALLRAGVRLDRRVPPRRLLRPDEPPATASTTSISASSRSRRPATAT